MKIKEGLETEYAEYVNKNSNDPYSLGVVTYIERWAELMERAIEDEKESIADVADSLSHVADTDGITGFMYGCAVQAMRYFWVYGEELRVWHNLNTQLGDEGEKANESGGVLNPAILNIG